MPSNEKQQAGANANFLYGVGTAAVALPKLPTFVKKTAGLLRTAAGETELLSGYSGPAKAMIGSRGYNIVTLGHVEGHAAALMHQTGVTEGTLFINNPVICKSCTQMLPRMLPPGASLKVVLPNGKSVTFTGQP
jgi:hypothetical protein